MGIVEGGPEEEGRFGGNTAFDGGDAALSGPGRIVEFLRQVPVMLAARRVRVGRPGLEVVTPVGQPVGFQPERVVLSGMAFVGVVAGEFDMVEAVPGAGE